MHWRDRMMAIALAGGSVAACSEAVERADVEGTVPPRGGDTATGLVTMPSPRALSSIDRVMPGDEAPLGGYIVPRCNANPDPCCQSPDLPMCQADAGQPGAGQQDAGQEVGPDDVSHDDTDIDAGTDDEADAGTDDEADAGTDDEADAGTDDEADAGAACHGDPATSPF
jgi:hypothetical protein